MNTLLQFAHPPGTSTRPRPRAKGKLAETSRGRMGSLGRRKEVLYTLGQELLCLWPRAALPRTWVWEPGILNPWCSLRAPPSPALPSPASPTAQ